MIFLLINRWYRCNRHKRGLRLCTALCVALVLNLVFGVGFYLAESGHRSELSFADSVWWSMVTMTTVGYGDYFPQTFCGRFLVAYPCLFFGIGLLGYLLGSTAQIVIEGFDQRKKGQATMRFTDHLVICQCPSTSRVLQLVEEFRASRADRHVEAVVVTDRLEEQPMEFREHSIHFVKGLPTSEETLLRAGVAHAAGVIVLAADRNQPASDAESFTTGKLVNLIEESGNRKIPLIMELADRKNHRMMERVDADGIVPVDGFTDRLLVQEMVSPGMRKLLEHLVTYKQGCEFYITEHRFAGRTLRDIQIAALQHPANIQVIGLVRHGEPILNPDNTKPLAEDEKLILIADTRADYERFESEVLKSPTIHSA